ncbi:MAG: glycosyltransferase family 4 protein [Acidobacteria bacterium]|nr:glycosyltransferase family 4 protein [Acidobacteriota bacterium]
MNVAVLMSGDSPWSRQVVRGIAENGHRVTTVEVPDHPLSGIAPSDRLQESGEDPGDGTIQRRSVRFGRRSIKGPGILRLALTLRETVRKSGSEHLLTLYGGSFALAAWLSRVRPFAVYVVGSDVLFMRGFRRVLTRVALNAARAVFVNGEYLARKTRELAPRAPVIPLLMGIDTDRFSPVGKPPHPVRIVCTRAFKPVYDNERLIDALRLLEEWDGDYTVTFTSAGPLLERARSAARERLSPEMLDRVEFLGGVSDDLLLDTVRKSHIYVSMSLSDGTSTSLLEALSCGVFPVVSDIPQNREWIDPSIGNGLLFPLRDTEALAEALRQSISNPVMRERAAGPNRASVVERGCNRKKMKQLSEILFSGEFPDYPRRSTEEHDLLAKDGSSRRSPGC